MSGATVRTGNRMLNRDGSFNVRRRGIGRITLRDLYHQLLRLRWRWFIPLLILADLAVNLMFGAGYYLCGQGALENVPKVDGWVRFWASFFFSIQTFATIGYGKLEPLSYSANILVAIESFLGLMTTGLVTGLLFARFARPTARVVFSRTAVINTHEGVPSLLFRMANRRLNQILEARVHVSVALTEKTAEGESYRTFYDLGLERAMSPIFALTWTVVHPIVKGSPLYGHTHQSLNSLNAEVIVSVTGIDDTFAQAIHARISYVPDEILWNHRFRDIISRNEEGVTLIELDGIHDVELIPAA